MTELVPDSHVFVVHGDLGRLACDDVLVPTDAERNVTEGWWALVGEDRLGEPGPYGRPVTAVDGWDDAAGTGLVVADGPPRRWLVDTAADDPDELAGRVQRFFAVLARDGHREPRYGRARPLIGLPLVGTGEGGAAGRRGDVIERLLPLLDDLAGDAGVDVALVLRDPRDHAAAQEVRRRMEPRWPLDDELVERADRLAALAREGRLALFLGAGVSRAAGLPMWVELLVALAECAGVDSAATDRLARFAPPDAAQIIVGRLGADGFAEEIRRLFDRREHALAHALLAALPVRQAVTTNFDPLFESAYEGAGRQLRLLPSAADELGEPWLVKLHGDVRRPDKLVLTREDFLRFPDEQAALAGVVQSLLLTRHVLFVGFSLVDDTFIAIAHQVRRVLGHARRDAAGGTVGTALALVDDELRRELWAGDLDYVAVAPAGTPLPEAARRLEIFLDRVAASATSGTGWLLDDRYAGLRTADDHALARALGEVATAGSAAAKSVGWPPVRALLDELGRLD